MFRKIFLYLPFFFHPCVLQMTKKNYMKVRPRLYIDRLAHWRCSLVDPQFEIWALAAVPNSTIHQENHAIFQFGLNEQKHLYHDRIRTQDHRIVKPMSYHWATTYLLEILWYPIHKSYESIVKSWGTARNIPYTAIYSTFVGQPIYI